MRGGAIVTTFIFSIIFLKIRVMKNQVLGAALALFGVMVVGLSNMVFSDASDGGADAVIIVSYLRVYKLLDICLLSYHCLLMDFCSFLNKSY